jgi:hypothetical protein
MPDKTLQKALENAQAALQEALDALQSGEGSDEAGQIDSPIGPRGINLGQGGQIPRIAGMDLQTLLHAKRLGKLGGAAGLDPQLAGLNLACDEGC